MTEFTPAARTRFIRANTEPQRPPLVPEVSLYLASEVFDLWQKSEEELAEAGVDPPFWAFAWAGGQALARYVLDNPEIARGRSVLDFGAGSGLVAIAAALAGAGRVTASDIDETAIAAIALNAEANGVAVEPCGADLTAEGAGEDAWEVILAGDICYEQAPSEAAMRWLKHRAGAGVTVLMGDPGRTFLPKCGLERLAGYGVKTMRELEDTDLRNAIVWRVLP